MIARHWRMVKRAALALIAGVMCGVCASVACADGDGSITAVLRPKENVGAGFDLLPNDTLQVTVTLQPPPNMRIDPNPPQPFDPSGAMTWNHEVLQEPGKEGWIKWTGTGLTIINSGASARFSGILIPLQPGGPGTPPDYKASVADLDIDVDSCVPPRRHGLHWEPYADGSAFGRYEDFAEDGPNGGMQLPPGLHDDPQPGDTEGFPPAINKNTNQAYKILKVSLRTSWGGDSGLAKVGTLRFDIDAPGIALYRFGSNGDSIQRITSQSQGAAKEIDVPPAGISGEEFGILTNNGFSAQRSIRATFTWESTIAGGGVETTAVDFVRLVPTWTDLGVDLAIDSDNDNGFNEPDRSWYEEHIEDISGDLDYPGKIVLANDGDEDGDGNDGIIDFADGFNQFGGSSDQTAGKHFVPLVLELPEPINITAAQLRISYDASDPDGVTRTGSGTEEDPYVYAPAPGGNRLRVWNEDGDYARNKDSVAAFPPGNYIPPGTYNDLAKLGFSSLTRTRTFYVEGIAESAVIAEPRIAVEIDPDGSGRFLPGDAVRVTVVRLNLIADTDRDGAVDSQHDQKDKANWTRDRGAIFSVNLDRDGGRTDGLGQPIPDAIHFDASGQPVEEDFEIQVTEQSEDLQDLAPVLIRKIGIIPNDFKVFLKADEESVRRIHVYKNTTQTGTENKAFWGGATATATSGADATGPATSEPETRTEIDITRWVNPASNDFQGDGAGDATFGLEGLMFQFGRSAPEHLRFAGYVDFTLELRRFATVIGASQVKLKVAPWIMLSRDQASEEVWAAHLGAENADFRTHMADGSGEQLQTVPEAGKHFLQDQLEIGYTQRPGGPKTHVVLRLHRTGATDWHLSRLLAKDVGVFRLGDLAGEPEEGDYGGNLEVLPPTPEGGDYPLGLIVTGNTASTGLGDFLMSQEVQVPAYDPPRPPTEWLSIGHIDEVVSFLGGSEVAVADPALAWGLLSNTDYIPAADRHKAVFFATGTAAPQGGTVGGAAMDRLYDGPATGLIKTVKVATRATGAITTVAKANLVDGETFTLGDGRATKTFEFDVAGDGVTQGRAAVDVSGAGITTANDVRDVMISAVEMNLKVTAEGSASHSGRIELTAHLPGAIGNGQIAETVADAGFTKADMAGGANDGILDGELVKIHDGTTEKVFEFDADGDYGQQQGRVQVDLSGKSAKEDVREGLLEAINGVGGGFSIQPVRQGPDLHLWNTAKADAQTVNQNIWHNVAIAGFETQGMAGGRLPWRDFRAGGTWKFVRVFTYTAAGKPENGQVAEIGLREDGYIEINNVWDTTSNLVPSGGFSIFDYILRTEAGGQGQAPHRTGEWFHDPTGTQQNPGKYVIVEGTKVWEWTGTPALVTVEEILADTAFQAINTTHAPERVEAVKAVLDAKVPELQCKSVPCLFFGWETDFPDRHSAVAFNPNPANLQTVNGNLYVAKQFGPLAASGGDIFEAQISGALGAGRVKWVDDWEAYHAYLGDVHCATAVKHAKLDVDWWENQPEP